MSADATNGQLWVRSADGQTWGPLPPPGARAMITRAQTKGAVLISTDGDEFLPLTDHVEAQILLGETSTTPSAPSAPVPPAPAPVPVAVAPPPPAAIVPEPPPPPDSQFGMLAEISPVKLYARIATEKATARLVLLGAERRVDVYFKRGVPEAVRSTDPLLSLGRYLLEKGALTPDKLAAAEAAAGSGPIEGALMATGALPANDLYQQLMAHAVAMLDAALALTRGEWRREPGVMPPAGSFPLGPVWGLLCESVRRWPHDRLAGMLGPLGNLPIMKADGGMVPMENLKLTAQEMRAAVAFNGASSVEKLAAKTPAEADALFRTAILLHELELVKFVGEDAPAAAPDPKAAAAAGAASEAKRMADDLAALRVAHEALKGADHFKVLGLDRKCTPAQVKATYFALAKTYHPDTVGQAAPPEVRKMKEDLFARVNEAYQTLNDEQSRKDYVIELEMKASGINPEAVFKSEEIFARASIMVKARKYDDALPMLEEAIKLYSGEGEYYAWRGYCKFLMAKDKRAIKDEVMAEIRKATELSPKCAMAYLFAGRIAKVLGDNKGAEMHFRKCLQLDHKMGEAESELRVLAKASPGGKK